jgi:hypothetical protein
VIVISRFSSICTRVQMQRTRHTNPAHRPVCRAQAQISCNGQPTTDNGLLTTRISFVSLNPSTLSSPRMSTFLDPISISKTVYANPTTCPRLGSFVIFRPRVSSPRLKVGLEAESLASSPRAAHRSIVSPNQRTRAHHPLSVPTLIPIRRFLKTANSQNPDLSNHPL